jgi:hypothetical protein
MRRCWLRTCGLLRLLLVPEGIACRGESGLSIDRVWSWKLVSCLNRLRFTDFQAN